MIALCGPPPAGDEGASRLFPLPLASPLSDPDRADGDPHELYFQAADSGRGEFVRLVFEEDPGSSPDAARSGPEEHTQ